MVGKALMPDEMGFILPSVAKRAEEVVQSGVAMLTAMCGAGSKYSCAAFSAELVSPHDGVLGLVFIARDGNVHVQVPASEERKGGGRSMGKRGEDLSTLAWWKVDRAVTNFHSSRVDYSRFDGTTVH